MARLLPWALVSSLRLDPVRSKGGMAGALGRSAARHVLQKARRRGRATA
ncbi:hypothetical protein CO676_27780 [Sinorhizobium sp. BJ1]|nr:hypothetical protein CO676_27780 [Sinorhizobium sp. BJ1]